MAAAECKEDYLNMSPDCLVTYNGTCIGPSLDSSITIPFVTKEVDYVQAGERWATKEVWTLNGEIIKCEGYEDILTVQDLILGYFSLDFKPLAVGDLDELPFARVLSVDFGESDYVMRVPYTIVLEGFRENGWETAFRVINPQASVQHTEEKDGTLTSVFTVSAKGVNTSNDASDSLANAKIFCQTMLETDRFNPDEAKFSPYLINSQNPSFKKFLVSEVESVNRLQSQYSITRTYKSDLALEPEDGEVLRYTIATDEAFGQSRTVTFSGTIDLGFIEGGGGMQVDGQGRGGGFPKLRSAYCSFKEEKTLDPDTGEKMTTILSEKIDEDTFGGLLSFTVIYGDDNLSCIDDYQISISESSSSSLIKASISGTVSAKGPCAWKTVLNCFYGVCLGEAPLPDVDAEQKPRCINKKYYERCYNEWRRFEQQTPEICLDPEEAGETDTPVVLNENPLSIRITEDKFNKKITYNIDYDDRTSWGAHSYDYTIDVQLPVRAVATNSFEDICIVEDKQASHHYRDLGFDNRASFNFNVNIIGNPFALPGEDSWEFARALLLEYTEVWSDAEDAKEDSQVEYLMIKNSHDGSEADASAASFGWTFPAAVGAVNDPEGDDYLSVRTLILKEE